MEKAFWKAINADRARIFTSKKVTFCKQLGLQALGKQQFQINTFKKTISMSEQGGKLERQVILAFGAEIASTMTRPQTGKKIYQLLAKEWETGWR